MSQTMAGSSLAKHLASSKQSTRDKATRLLATWLPSKSQLSDDDMKKIWKGLFYCIWHADKQQYQLELINRLASLLVSLDLSLSVHYFELYLLTMRREWSGIDYLRLDKFYLLNRRFLYHLFLLCKMNGWGSELVRKLMGILEHKTLLSADKYPAKGINYHLVDIFWGELKGFLPLDKDTLEILVKPFLAVLGNSLDKVLLNKIKSNLFGCLLDNGRKLLHRTKQGGEPDSADEVELFGTIPSILNLSNKFFDLGSSEDCVQGNRKVLFGLHEEFARLEKDMTTSGVKISIPRDDKQDDGIIKKLSKKAKKGAGVLRNEDGKEDSGVTKKLSKKINKGEVGTAEVLKNKDGKVDNGAIKKKSSKKIKKGEVETAGVFVEQVNNKDQESIETSSKKKTKKTSGGSATKKSKKTSTTPGSDVFEGEIDKVSNSESMATDAGLVNLNETVISNLQMQFEKIAAEAGMEADGCGSPVTPVISTVPKKRKRVKSVTGKVECLSSQALNEGGAVGKSGEKSSKKVRFSMKNNLIWKPHSPLPPQSLRLPPSATPRGSALKKGIPAGPVIETPNSMLKKVKRKTSSLKKARKGLKSVSPSVKRLKKLRSYSA